MNTLSDPVFLLFLGFTIFAVIYAVIIIYISLKDKNNKASSH